MNFTLKRREFIHKGVVFDLIVDHIEYPSGNGSVREVAKHPGGAVVVPVFDNGDVLMIKQYRYPIDKFIYELPAGKLDPEEDPEDCARRELEEETGYKAERLAKLTAFYTTPGFCTEKLHIYLATGLQKLESGQQLEEGEASISIETIPLKQALDMIESQEIVDGKTIVGLFLAMRRVGELTVN
jgi:ADP-ribose pyrophosphatase